MEKDTMKKQIGCGCMWGIADLMMGQQQYLELGLSIIEGKPFSVIDNAKEHLAKAMETKEAGEIHYATDHLRQVEKRYTPAVLLKEIKQNLQELQSSCGFIPSPRLGGASLLDAASEALRGNNRDAFESLMDRFNDAIFDGADESCR